MTSGQPVTLRTAIVLFLAFSCTQVSLSAQEFKSCGISDIDQIRKEVKSAPTTTDNYLNRRAALSRWFRLLWHQGYDMSSLRKTAGYISYFKPDSRFAPSTLDRGYAILEEIQRDPKRIPEIKGTPGRTGSKTNWPMYLGIDGSNTGYSPDPGPSTGEIVWRFPKHNSWNAKPVMKDDRIYVSAPGADVVGYCLDQKTGKILWRARQHGFDLYSTRGSILDPIVTEDRVMIRIDGVGSRNLVVDRGTGQPIQNLKAAKAGPGQKLMAYLLNDWVRVAEARTGRDLWQKKLPAEPAGVPVLIGGKMYAATQDGTVSRIDITTRETEWERKLPAPIRGRVTVEKERVCVGTADGRLYCLNWADGKVLWSWQCQEQEDKALQFFSPPRVANQRVYVGAASGYLYCLTASSGALIWKYRTGSWIRSRPLVIGDMVYAATLDSDLYAIEDGGSEAQKRWQMKVGAHGFTADLVGDRSRILLSGKDLILYSVAPATGEVQWRHGIIDGTWIEGEFFACSWMTGFMTSPAVVDDIMYIGGPDGFVNAVDVTTGKEIWRFELGGILSAVPVVAESKVFVGREGRGTSRFCALDKDTGKLVWESKVFGLTWVAPAYNRGMLFVGNRAGDLFGVNASNGNVVWSYYLATNTPFENRPRDHSGDHGWPPGVYSNPAIDDKNVYVGSWIGYYFALDQKTGKEKWRTKTKPEHGGLPDSAAPMLHKGHLYVQKAGRYIAALHKDTGQLRWEWEAPTAYLQNGTVAAHGDKIFGSFAQGVTTLPCHATVIAFDDVESGGKKLWEYDGGGGLTAPVLADGKVIFGSSADMFVTCLNSETGSVMWRTFTGGEMLENVPALYGDKVFVQCKNGWVFAIR